MPKKKIPFRNRSPSGWWIFREVEQWISDRQRKLTSRSRCLVWHNTRVLKAKTREEAYRKAMKFAMIGDGTRTVAGHWRSLGISMLLPIYEDIDDGAEILWEETESMTIAKANALIRTKKQLSVFDDSERKEA
jgi:hypothetical protein